MSQIGSVNVNFNLPVGQNKQDNMAKSLIAGVSQRGPIYKVVEIEDISKFIIVFGQPTNKYEFDFFQAMKSVVGNGGKALCYRIPYTDDKQLDSATSEYYIVRNIQYDKIGTNDEGDFNIALLDSTTNIYYYLKVDDDPVFKHVLKLVPVETPDKMVQYIVIKSNQSFYKVYIDGEKLYTIPLEDYETPDNAYNQFYVKYIATDEFDFFIDIYGNERSDTGIGLYIKPATKRDEITSDIRYKSSDEVEIDNYLAKFTLTPINDFNSILHISANDETTDISADQICFKTRVDIDPSQLIGVFPILFAPRDAENVRNLNFDEVYPYSPNTEHYIDEFNVFACDGKGPYRISSSILFDNLFDEFEKSTHFKKNWLEMELSKFMDQYVPQDISTCKNTMGVVFMAYYLDDEHKLDYKVLESYYGLVGYSNKSFKNIEDLVNAKSNFFRMHIEGIVDDTQYLRALNKDSFSNDGGIWVLPMISPFTPPNKHLVDMSSIFSINPSVKFNLDDPQKPYTPYKYPLSRLLDKLSKTEYLNSVPFDYFVTPGLSDIMLLVDTDPDAQKVKYSNSLVPYYDYQVNLENDTSIEITKTNDVYDLNVQYENVASLYRLMTFGTSLGDKGCISIIDVPYIFNEYFIENIDKYATEADLKKMLKVLDRIFPNLIGTREIYDRTYPIYNYQRVDKDLQLTRYHKLRPWRKFEIVPGSAMMVGSYINETMNDVFDPIAGPRIRELFRACHNCLEDMKRPDIFKALFDLYGVSSLINDKDNNTFPIQQTTWRNTTSILKQLHAFRIYVAIRRRAYDIVKSYLYEPNIEVIRNNMLAALSNLLYKFKEKKYIDPDSNAQVWADISDIEQNQVQVVMTVGIYGAIIKIVINMNLQNMTIEMVQ